MNYILPIVAIVILAVAVLLSPIMFGQQPANVTPAPEPTRGSIPPLPPFAPIAPQTDRAYLPLVYEGKCSEDLFYWCSGVVR